MTPPTRLSHRQAAALRHVVAYLEAHGYPPSVAELADDMGRSVSTTHALLAALEAKGYIRTHGQGRAIEIVGAEVTVTLAEATRAALRNPKPEVVPW